MFTQFCRWGCFLLVLSAGLTGGREALALGWKEDADMAIIPPGALIGKINGERFQNINAKVENGILTLREGGDFFAEREIMIFLFLKEGDNIFGKKYKVSQHITSGVPHVHMKWKPEGQNLPETQTFVGGYSMQLEFSGNQDGQSAGKIYLSLPDPAHSYVYGHFFVTPEIAPPPAVVKAEVEEVSSGDETAEPEGGEIMMLPDMETLKEMLKNLSPLSMAGAGLAILGFIIMTIASFWYLVNTFRAGIGWGILMLLLAPIVGIIFLFARWSYAKRPFLVSILGFVLYAGGIGLAVYGIGPENFKAKVSPYAEKLPKDFAPYEAKASEGLSGLKNKVKELADMPVENTGPRITAGPLVIGDSLAKLQKELGEPQGHVGSGNKETYYYNGLEVWVEDGQISNIIER